MNKILPLLYAAIPLVFLQCQIPDYNVPFEETSQTLAKVELPGTSFGFEGNGKVLHDETTDEIYSYTSLEDVQLPAFSKELILGLKKQLKVLRYRKNKHLESFGTLDLTIDKLEQTVQSLLDQQYIPNPDLSATLDAYKLKGKDGMGNVYFTGYFTPVLKASLEKTATYKYPLYAYPKNWEGRLPSRQQIDGEDVLEGKNLELAYVKNPLDIYFMQVQGSGIVEYPDGRQEIFAYAGDNGWKYRSIGRHMIKKGYATEQNVSLNRIKKFFKEHPELIDTILFENPSYVFFNPARKTATPKGAGSVSLTTDYSIAVDPDYIPLGSCMLAAVPVINKRNKVIRHDFRVLIAQDVGGVIKGPGRVDLYTGVGHSGRRKASALHHYGNLWLLVPKDSDKAGQKGKMTASL